MSKYLALRIALEETPGLGPEPPALDDVSEKQYTIYITTAGGAFTVSWGPRGWGRWEELARKSGSLYEGGGVKIPLQQMLLVGSM